MKSFLYSIQYDKWLAPVFILIMSLLLGCDAKQIPQPNLPAGKIVRTLVLEAPEVDSMRQFPGRVEANQRAELAFQVSGVLTELPIREGALVAQGDLLARLDPRDYENALKARRADAEEAKKQFDRFVTLLRSKTVSKAQYEEAQARYEVARALIAQAEKNLEDTFLRAPFAGRIAEIHMQNFQNVKPKQPVVLLEDIARLDVVIQLPEQDFARLPTGKSLLGLEVGTVTLEVLPEIAFPVTVKAYETRANDQTHTYKVTLTMLNPEDAVILPGMTATFVPSGNQVKQQRAFAIPVTAVTASPDGKSQVWIVEQDLTVAVREVVMGQLTDADVRVLGGLEAGDRIVIQGAPYLENGDKVRLQDTGKES